MVMYRLIFTLVIGVPIFVCKQGNFWLMVFNTYLYLSLVIGKNSKRFKQGIFLVYVILPIQ